MSCNAAVNALTVSAKAGKEGRWPRPDDGDAAVGTERLVVRGPGKGGEEESLALGEKTPPEEGATVEDMVRRREDGAAAAALSTEAADKPPCEARSCEQSRHWLGL